MVRKERLAVNLYDLDRVEPSLRAKLLTGRLDLSKPLKMDWDRKEGEDEWAVLFSCPLLEAAVICDTIRSHDRAVGDFPTRLYLLRKAWSRIPSYSVLTVVAGETKCRLNPKIFPAISTLVSPAIPPRAKPLF